MKSTCCPLYFYCFDGLDLIKIKLYLLIPTRTVESQFQITWTKETKRNNKKIRLTLSITDSGYFSTLPRRSLKYPQAFMLNPNSYIIGFSLSRMSKSYIYSQSNIYDAVNSLARNQWVRPFKAFPLYFDLCLVLASFFLLVNMFVNIL